MKISNQLSVSSVILAAVISTGCSQQQVVGGSQVSGGSSQMSGGSQVAGGGQMTSQSQIEGGSQQQVQQPIVVAPIPVYKPVYKPAPAPIYKPRPVVRKSTRSSGIGLPPARPGQCFAKVKQPAKYITKFKKTLVKKATSRRVLVRGPQYGWATKRVLVRKAAYKTRTTPAQYRNTSKRVLVKPAYYKWSKKAQGKVVRIDHMTGEVLCRVKVPAVYKTVTKRVQVRPAHTQRTLVPAAYKTVKVKKLVAQAKYKTVNTPAQYRTSNYRVKVGSARFVWRQVACKAHAKPHKKYYQKKAAYRKPTKQYRKAAPRRTQQYNKSGISLHEYYSVMNAGKGKKATSKKMAPKHKKRKVLKMKKVAPKKTMITKPKAAVVKPATVAKPVAAAKDDAKKQMSKTNVIRSIQKALKEKGFDPGPADGVMGAGTAAALKAFQSSRGLPVGRLTKDTFRALGLIR